MSPAAGIDAGSRLMAAPLLAGASVEKLTNCSRTSRLGREPGVRLPPTTPTSFPSSSMQRSARSLGRCARGEANSRSVPGWRGHRADIDGHDHACAGIYIERGQPAADRHGSGVAPRNRHDAAGVDLDDRPVIETGVRKNLGGLDLAAVGEFNFEPGGHVDRLEGRRDGVGADH